ncbi:flagellar biosynthesis protein FlhF [Dethiobacter alkaliphilus]|uniref:flagellar biosynthesis protein FlhF n=1 Tax=Dethiobacter alkaliphilus TaxID=427926 RepID=UPI002226508D|nr:flagellar biosynthesis protein FlhF [Dethiobacter alkaliphilus]MCW3488729.1 flagellar biosynthesis protein FlhF [Dethiobacter alkaliphilus]
MKIKKYCVDTVQEGMLQIKKELGPEAVIIESRKVREKGFRGLFAPVKVEITAAVDTPVRQQPVAAARQPERQEERLQSEITELKQMVNQLVSRQQKQNIEEKGPFYRWMQRLIDNDVDPALAQQILTEIHEDFAAENALSDEVVELILQKKVREHLRTADVPDTSRVLTFVGPTGVGKTTTLAKLAARFALYHNKQVGMITIDTYRIGAVEQLRTYADITGMPIEVVMTPKDMAQALERLADREIILVDTAGRNAKNSMQVSELAVFMEALPAPETFLVLSATTKTKDLQQIIAKFNKVNFNRLIFTKLDETETYGALLNVANTSNLPITYLTTGQNVPDDIENATADKLAKLILGVEQNV